MSYVSDPIKFAVAVTPADNTDIGPFRAIYVGGTGDVAIKMYGNGATVTFANLAVGWHPIQGTRILATGTGATDIIAGW